MRALVAAAVLIAVAGCGSDNPQPAGGGATAPDPTAPMSLTVTSTAFEDGGVIPSTYTCQGKGISPPIQWTGVDFDKVDRLALVVDDPDAPGGDYVHWVVLGIPSGHGAIDEGTVPDGATEVAGTGGPGWKPPCPPSGTHHYRFTVYALPSDLSASRNAPSLTERLADLADRAVAWGRLTGTVTAK